MYTIMARISQPPYDFTYADTIAITATVRISCNTTASYATFDDIITQTYFEICLFHARQSEVLGPTSNRVGLRGPM